MPALHPARRVRERARLEGRPALPHPLFADVRAGARGGARRL
jgi:hypothetical protein